jgi:hypothetical protein
VVQSHLAVFLFFSSFYFFLSFFQMGCTGLLALLRSTLPNQSWHLRKIVSHIQHKQGREEKKLNALIDGHCWLHAAAMRHGKQMVDGDFRGFVNCYIACFIYVPTYLPTYFFLSFKGLLLMC